MPTLGDVLRSIGEIDDELIIYVARDGRPNVSSIVELITLDLIGSVNPDFRYLLEVQLAKDVMETWSEWRDGRASTIYEACAAVVYYSEHDAYIPVEG